MNFKNFDNTMKIFFDKLHINPLEFNLYNKRLVSKEPFSYKGAEEYYMVIKLYNNIGTVSIGTSNGPKYTEQEVLGQIAFTDTGWVNV